MTTIELTDDEFRRVIEAALKAAAASPTAQYDWVDGIWPGSGLDYAVKAAKAELAAIREEWDH